MTVPKNCRLLFGPYVAPALRSGDRATCLVRDCDVIVTSWTDARIPWPRCQPPGRGGNGVLVDEELARAVRHEAAVAIRYWWGVGTETMAWWRRALGVVGHDGTEGSRRLILAAGQVGADFVKHDGLSDTVCDQISTRSKELNLIRFARAKPAKKPWSKRELVLLGKHPDELVAQRIGRTAVAVRVMRTKLRIPPALDRRRGLASQCDDNPRKNALPPSPASS